MHELFDIITKLKKNVTFTHATKTYKSLKLKLPTYNLAGALLYNIRDCNKHDNVPNKIY